MREVEQDDFKFNHPYYNSGYLRAILNLEQTLLFAMADCKRSKVRFDKKQAKAFFKIFNEHHIDFRERCFGTQDDPFIRVNQQTKELEYYSPIKQKEVVEALLECLK